MNLFKKLFGATIKKIEAVENAPFDPLLWILTFFCVIALRIFIELSLTKIYSLGKLDQEIFSHSVFLIFSHSFFYFLILFLVLSVVMKKFLKIGLKKIFNLMLYFGFFLILASPLVDYLFSSLSGKGFWSFYEFYGLKDLFIDFITFFGKDPFLGITPGPRLFALISTLLFFAYSFIKSRRWIFSALFSFLVYFILFIFGSIPSWITMATKSFSKGLLNIDAADVAQDFLSPLRIFSTSHNDILTALVAKLDLIYSFTFSILIFIFFLVFFKAKFLSILKNIRIPQLIVHEGLLIIGMLLGVFYLNLHLELNLFNLTAFLIIAESVALSWIASVLFNDIFDLKIDKMTNRNRPLIANPEDKKLLLSIGIAIFILAIWMSAFVNIRITFLLIIYQILAWAYSAWPMRLKRFPFISTFISATALVLILFSGILLVSGQGETSFLPSKILFLFFFAYTFSLPIKDFKDIEGDRADGVFTIPVVFGEYWGKIIVGSGIFASFLLSVIIINESSLFWWALILGGISFWLVNKMSTQSGSNAPFINLIKNPKQIMAIGVNYRNIFWWMLGMVAIYGLILVKIIFL